MLSVLREDAMDQPGEQFSALTSENADVIPSVYLSPPTKPPMAKHQMPSVDLLTAVDEE